jgi:hypothetical protein
VGDRGKCQVSDVDHRMFRCRVKPRLWAVILAQKVRSEPCSDAFGTISHFLDPEPDLRSGSAISLNFEPNLGSVQAGSGSNHGSEPNSGITRMGLEGMVSNDDSEDDNPDTTVLHHSIRSLHIVVFDSDRLLLV